MQIEVFPTWKNLCKNVKKNCQRWNPNSYKIFTVLISFDVNFFYLNMANVKTLLYCTLVHVLLISFYTSDQDLVFLILSTLSNIHFLYLSARLVLMGILKYILHIKEQMTKQHLWTNSFSIVMFCFYKMMIVLKLHGQ